MEIVYDLSRNQESDYSINGLSYFAGTDIEKCPELLAYFRNNPTITNFGVLASCNMYSEAMQMYPMMPKVNLTDYQKFSFALERKFIEVCIELQEYEKASKALKELIISISNSSIAFAFGSQYFDKSKNFQDFLKSPELEKEMREIYVLPENLNRKN
jgi:hypothetical protein